MKKIFSIITCILFSQIQFVYAQNNKIAKPKKPNPYSKETTFGAQLNTNGWSIFSEIARYKPYVSKKEDIFYNASFFSVEFTEKRHPQELSRISNYLIDGKYQKYKYGKVNQFYSLKLGYGIRRQISGKVEPRAIAINWVANGGLSLGLMKPIYLSVTPTPGNPNQNIGISYNDDPQGYFTKPYHIIKKETWSTGLGEMKYIPGLHAKTGFRFEFGNNESSVTAVELGGGLDFYTSDVQIMVNDKNKLFTQLYVNLQFGKRQRAK